MKNKFGLWTNFLYQYILEIAVDSIATLQCWAIIHASASSVNPFHKNYLYVFVFYMAWWLARADIFFDVEAILMSCKLGTSAGTVCVKKIVENTHT